MNRNILVGLLLMLGVALHAQTSIHLDKPYYLAGEHIFFSFCNSAIETDSAIARVRLYDNSRVVDTYFVQVLDHCGEGYLKLPYRSETGAYNFEVSLFCGQDFEPATLARVSLSIYNDEDRAVLADGAAPMPAPSPAQSSDRLVSLEAQPMAPVPLTLDLPDEVKGRIARVSVAVRDQHIYGNKLETVHRHEPLLPLEDAKWGIPFYGRRINAVESQIRNPLLFALNSENLVFDATEVNLKSKAFTMSLTPFYESKQINFLDYLDDSVKIEQIPPQSRPVVPASYDVDSLLIQHLDIYREEKTINQVFQQISLPVQEDSTDLITLPMQPNYIADVQDFAIRGTTVSLFKELITPLKFRSIGKDKYRGRMLYERNNIKKYYSRPPLFVVNGRATRNGPVIAKFPLQEIGFFRIYSLYDDLEQISPMAFGGLVYVEMLDPNYELQDRYAQPTFAVQGLQLPAIYPVAPVFSEQSPTVGSLLYWDPNAAIEDGKLRCDFNTMETTSDYLVEVVVHLKDSDQPVVVRQLLEVGKNQK